VLTVFSGRKIMSATPRANKTLTAQAKVQESLSDTRPTEDYMLSGRKRK